jgi:hypothetical protein
MTVQVSQIIIGALIVIGFFGSLLMMLFNPSCITEHNSQPVMIMVGALVAAFAGLTGYFFGSSAGSAKKTELLARAEPIIDLTTEVK